MRVGTDLQHYKRRGCNNAEIRRFGCSELQRHADILVSIYAQVITTLYEATTIIFTKVRVENETPVRVATTRTGLKLISKLQFSYTMGGGGGLCLFDQNLKGRSPQQTS